MQTEGSPTKATCAGEVMLPAPYTVVVECKRIDAEPVDATTVDVGASIGRTGGLVQLSCSGQYTRGSGFTGEGCGLAAIERMGAPRGGAAVVRPAALPAPPRLELLGSRAAPRRDVREGHATPAIDGCRRISSCS